MGQQQRDNCGERRRKGGPLNALTFLAPGIPLEFFEIVTGCIVEALSCEIQLSAEDRISGPMHAAADPFDEGRADLGFLCSPSYLYLRAQARPSVELVPAGFVFRDRRAAGRPVYFSEVVVRSDHSAREFADLAGSVWGYNDECSLSGYFSALQKLSELGCDGSFFGRRVRTGSHLESVEAVLSGAIDGAAIDSTVFAIDVARSTGPARRDTRTRFLGPVSDPTGRHEQRARPLLCRAHRRRVARAESGRG